ncbi:DUF2846 domain-containing protein [Variovorax sp. LARHSF232]
MIRCTTWLAAGLLALLTGCASGPRYADIAPNIPPPEPEQGRIFFYRSSVMGAAIQPDLRLDGQVVGSFAPRGFFYVDRPLGRYTAQARTEAEAKLDIDVLPQRTSYVEMSIGLGFVIGQPKLALRTPTEALPDMVDLAYIGKHAVASAPSTPGKRAEPVPAASTATTTLAADAPSATPAGLAPAAAREATAVSRGEAQGGHPPAKTGTTRLVEYRLNDRMGGPERVVNFRFFEAEGERISFNNGTWFEKPDGTFIEARSQIAGDFDTAMPPGGWVRPQSLTAGASWTERYSRNVGAGRVDMDIVAVVSGPDTLVITGRAMPVVLIEYRGYTSRFTSSMASSQNQTARYRASAWYSPELRRVVRFNANSRGGASGGAFVVDEELNLVSIR